MHLNIYGLFKKFFKKTEDISDKLQNILQSFLLKSKLCACLYVKYFIRDLNRDLFFTYILSEKAVVGNHISKTERQELFFWKLFSFQVSHRFREDAEVFS